MIASTKRGESVKALIFKAADFHGHLGPFLAIGVRTGLVGLRELNAKPGDTKLRVTVRLKYDVPFSCMLDGVQAVTKCTAGNKRLSWKDSEQMSAVFSVHDNSQVEVIINSAAIQELRHKLADNPSDETVRKLALDIASRSEKDLLSVKRM